jgi:cytoskeletal protein RodZ
VLSLCNLFIDEGDPLVGEILKKRREELGRDLREISNNLRIRHDYLKALEDGDLDKLPAEVYVKGYIQEYAKILNMAPEPLLNTYAEQSAPSLQKSCDVPEEKSIRGNPLRKRYVLISSIVIVLGVIAFFQLVPSQKKSGSTAPVVQTKGELISGIADSGLVLKIVATDTTWLLVTIDKGDSKEILMKPGDAITWQAKKCFVLKIGNAGGIRLVFNGREMKNLGERGQVIKINLPESGV